MAWLTAASGAARRRLQFDRQRHHAGAADHDDVVAQPQDGAQQRTGIRSAGEFCGALALGLDAEGIQRGKRSADAVLQGMQGVIVAASGQAGQQFIERRGQQLQHARGADADLAMRPRRQHQKRDRKAGDARRP